MMMTRSDAAAFLAEQDHFCILTHSRPDGDTIGCAAALCRGLRQLGKTAHVLLNPETDGKLLPFLKGLTTEAARDTDTLVSVDVPAVNLFPAPWAELTNKIRLSIDHHFTNFPFAERTVLDASAAACGEIVYDILMEMGVKPDQELAKAVYLAISTDSGCFRFSTTSAHTFAVAAACAATGADLFSINQKFFDTNSLGKLKLQNWMVEHTLFLKNGAVAVCAMPPEVEASVCPDDSDSLSSFLRSIEGVKVSAYIRQGRKGAKISMRAVPGYDVGAVCTQFGGGGHKPAAGANTTLSLEEATRQAAAALCAIVEDE